MSDLYRQTYLSDFLGHLRDAYDRLKPVEAYIRNTHVIESAYMNGNIDMHEVRRFLGQNGDMLREKGGDPWEVICGKGLQW